MSERLKFGNDALAAGEWPCDRGEALESALVALERRDFAGLLVALAGEFVNASSGRIVFARFDRQAARLFHVVAIVA